MAEKKEPNGYHVRKEKEKLQERIRDERIKLQLLEIVMAHGREQDKSMPWNFANKLFTYVKYGNPDMEIK